MTSLSLSLSLSLSIYLLSLYFFLSLYLIAMVSSRSYDDSERGHEWAMIPGGDMTNHKFRSMSLGETENRLEFRTNSRYQQGEEVRE
jgi:hypothetical protein